MNQLKPVPIVFDLNGCSRTLNVDSQMPLLWALREQAGLTGTKYGCGVGICGACTIHVDGKAVRSCVFPTGQAQGCAVRTIEALGTAGAPHLLQRSWVRLQVPQCGYCQSGMLMAAAALLAHTPDPSDSDIDAAITNLCRCGTYPRVRAAIHQAARDRHNTDAAIGAEPEGNVSQCGRAVSPENAS